MGYPGDAVVRVHQTCTNDTCSDGAWVRGRREQRERELTRMVLSEGIPTSRILEVKRSRNLSDSKYGLYIFLGIVTRQTAASQATRYQCRPIQVRAMPGREEEGRQETVIRHTGNRKK